MKRVRNLLFSTAALATACLQARGQGVDAQWNESGRIEAGGHAMPYIIRHLPVSSFPQLPLAVQEELNRRGCLVPQTYEARGPENVVSASLERRGSTDWAVLCSSHGTVSLLVFFADSAEPTVLATGRETARLQQDGASGVMGFDWGISAATPQQVREAQAGMRRKPPLLDHDALADSLIDQTTVYHYYSGGKWVVVETSD